MRFGKSSEEVVRDGEQCVPYFPEGALLCQPPALAQCGFGENGSESRRGPASVVRQSPSCGPWMEWDEAISSLNDVSAMKPCRAELV